MENQYTWIIPNTKCWYYQKKQIFDDDDEEENANQNEEQSDDINDMYIMALITSSDSKSKKAQILLNNKKKTIKVNFSEIFQASQLTNQKGVDDMVQMDCLNEAEIIANVTMRYTQNIIFTYIGPTLIIINPYKVLDEVFHENRIKEIQKCLKSNPNFTLQNYQPHIYAIAGLAYQNVFKNDKKQAIVISGESGAGKTENAKYAMRFLASLSADIYNENDKNINQKSILIEEKILSCNPILEAFGNAKTVRNDNSSRFGKYSTITFDNTTWKITGAKIQKYLLEKSRITQLAKDERNYHIFYHLLKGADQGLLKQLMLDNYLNSQKQIEFQRFQYLSTSGCFIAEQINDKENYQKVKTSFDKMNIPTTEQMFVWQILAAILLIGNIEFDDEELGLKDSSCKIQDEETFKKICQLLQCDVLKLQQSILFKTRIIQNQVIQSPIKLEDCVAIKNSLSKSLYDHLFAWLVERLNREIFNESCKDLSQENQQQLSFKQENLGNKVLSIGLLDIFGFENFKTNRLEQLCINYTNEHLQQLYISYVFKSELNVLSEDGLEKYLDKITYEDNQIVIDIFDAKQGIFNLMSDFCKVDSNDTKMLQSILNIGKTNKRLKTQKVNSNTFTIDHTQSPVTYLIDGFRVKNMDEVNKEIIMTLDNSENQIVKDIFQNSQDLQEFRQSNSPSKSNIQQQQQLRFLGVKFKQEMNDLMHELQVCEVHFVRCIKPNNLKKEMNIDVKFVLLQIRYLGVLDSIYIRKATYPCRKTYLKFFSSYKYCHDDFIRRRPTENQLLQVCKDIINKIFQNVTDNQVLYGTKRVYIKQELEQKLDSLKYEKIKQMMKVNSVKIIAVFKGYKVRKMIKQKKEASKKIVYFISNKFTNSLLKTSLQLIHEMAMSRPKPEKKMVEIQDPLSQQQIQNQNKIEQNQANKSDQILNNLYQQTQSLFAPNKRLGNEQVPIMPPIGSISYFQNIHLYMDEEQAKQVNDNNDGFPDYLKDIDQQDISVIKSQNFELKKLLQENSKQAKYQQIAISHQNIEINDLRRTINELRQINQGQAMEIQQIKEQNVDLIIKINQLDPGYKFIQQVNLQNKNNVPFSQQTGSIFNSLINDIDNNMKYSQQSQTYGYQKSQQFNQQTKYQQNAQPIQQSNILSPSIQQQQNLQSNIDLQIQASLSNITQLRQQQQQMYQNQVQNQQQNNNQQLTQGLIQQAQKTSQLIYQPQQNQYDNYMSSIKNVNTPIDLSIYKQPQHQQPTQQGFNMFNSYNQLSRPILYSESISQPQINQSSIQQQQQQLNIQPQQLQISNQQQQQYESTSFSLAQQEIINKQLQLKLQQLEDKLNNQQQNVNINTNNQ